jgi:hypothetical protein
LFQLSTFLTFLKNTFNFQLKTLSRFGFGVLGFGVLVFWVLVFWCFGVLSVLGFGVLMVWVFGFSVTPLFVLVLPLLTSFSLSPHLPSFHHFISSLHHFITLSPVSLTIILPPPLPPSVTLTLTLFLDSLHSTQ